MASPYSSLSLLIVDKKLNDLGQLREFFSELGVGDISVASSANMALNFMRARSFDLCVVESDLGQGEKTGLQVIEEAHREGLKRATSAFILVAPSQTRVLPNDSLACAPDTFITKPYDFQKLRVRFDKLMALKRAVRPLEELVDGDNLEHALKATETYMQKLPALRVYLLRIKGRLLLALERYAEAQVLFREALETQPHDWVRMGLGISLIKQGRYPEALSQLAVILEHNSASMEAYDWLSKIYRSLGNTEKAQQLLENAAQLFPTAPIIQSGLGDVASENQRWDTAIEAFRKAVRYARHSCHQHENNYFGLARCLQTRIQPQGGGVSREAEEEAVRALEEVQDEYRGDPRVRFKSRLMTSETHRKSGDQTRADAAARDAYEVYKQLPADDQASEIENLMEGVEGTLLEEDVAQYRSQFNQQVALTTSWGKLNLQGMQCYRKGQLEQAFGCFSQALEQVGNSPSILLNLVQTGLAWIKQDPSRSAEVLAICNERLLEMSIGAMNVKQQERFRVLSARRAALQKPSEASGD